MYIWNSVPIILNIQIQSKAIVKQMLERPYKYRPTIGNISAAFILGFAVYRIVNSGLGSWELLSGIGLLSLCGILMLVDFLLQKLMKNYWVLSSIELAMLLLAFLSVKG
jgi:glucose dehydrogenase